MEINESMSLETFPKSYEACFLESCSVKENCLYHLYFKLQPSTNTWVELFTHLHSYQRIL